MRPLVKLKRLIHNLGQLRLGFCLSVCQLKSWQINRLDQCHQTGWFDYYFDRCVAHFVGRIDRIDCDHRPNWAAA